MCVWAKLFTSPLFLALIPQMDHPMVFWAFNMFLKADSAVLS